jgi:hypothetical protein
MEKKIEEQIWYAGHRLTLGVGAKHDVDYFHDTGLSSKKVLMLQDKTKIKATNKMWLKQTFSPKHAR